MKIKAIIGVMSLLALCGCAMVGPNYARPAVKEPNQWLEKDSRIKSEPVDLSAWWKAFNDPVLDNLIERAYQENLTLQAAGIRILEARAQLGIAIGNLYPQTQNVGGSLNATRISKNSANTTSDADFEYNDLGLDFNIAWEIDFWGKFRRAVQSNRANLEGTIANYDAVLVSLTADVALSYVLTRTFEARIEVAQKNVSLQERTLQIVEAQYEGGLVSELDLQQARNLLYTTKASIPPLEASRSQSQNALATLLGTLPENMPEILSTPAPIPSAPVEVALGIPAELVRRRPDIRLAERQVAAQSSLIGLARADLYPHFSLFGTIGFRTSDASVTAAGTSTDNKAKLTNLLIGLLGGNSSLPVTRPGGSDLGDIFNSKSLEWFAGPSFNWDIFNYGRIKNRVRVEDARFQELAVNYQNTVLRAFQEVEDGLVGFLQADDARRLLLEAVGAAKRSVDISLLQYDEGMVDYQRVLDAERSLATSEDALVSATGSETTNLINVYRALGGGWEIRIGKDFVSAETRDEMRRRTNWGKLLPPDEAEQKNDNS